MNPNQNRPIENLIEGLSQHARFLTKEERIAELRERGIDVDGFLKEAHSIIAHHQKADRLAWMKVAEEKAARFSALENRFVSWVGKSKEEIVAAGRSREPQSFRGRLSKGGQHNVPTAYPGISEQKRFVR